MPPHPMPAARRPRVLVLLTVVGAMFLLGSVAGRAADGPAFTVTTKREADRVSVSVEKDRAVFAVHSATGIGGATIARTGENWPAVIVVRLNLRGLESFRASN